MIKYIAQLEDKKINSLNVQFLIDIRTYVNLAKSILGNNDFQRQRISKRGSVYSLLKEDVLKGCVMPSIVLASTFSDFDDTAPLDDAALEHVLNRTEELKILDGLQRTFTLIDTFESNEDYFNSLSQPYLLRMELYVSITEAGILYRMLTLNTGQTPMTLRHQLEMLYSRYLGSDLGDIRVIRDAEGLAISSVFEYKFADLIDGYTSFLEVNELPVDKFDILNAVKTTNFVSVADLEKIGFNVFVESYHSITMAFFERYNDWFYPAESDIAEEYSIESSPYGKSVQGIFNRSQSLTGFGAAVANLIEAGSINSMKDVSGMAKKFIFDEDDLLLLNKCLDDVKGLSKKIGNGQRIFFKCFFKFLLDSGSETQFEVRASLQRARRRAIAEIF